MKQTLILALLAASLMAQVPLPGGSGGGGGAVASVSGSAGVACTPITGAVDCALETSIAQTRSNAQGQQDLVIVDVAVTDTYPCNLAASGRAIPALGAGTIGTLWQLYPAVGNTLAATCQGLSIVKANGNALATGDIVASKANFLYQYDATTLRLVTGGGAPILSTAGQGVMYAPFNTPNSSNIGDTYGGARKTAPVCVQTIGTGLTASKMMIDVGLVTGVSVGYAVAIYSADGQTKLQDVTSQVVTSGQRTTVFTIPTPFTFQANVVYSVCSAVEDNTFTQYEQDVGNIEMVVITNEGASLYRWYKGTNAATGTGASLAMPAAMGAHLTLGTFNGLPIYAFVP